MKTNLAELDKLVENYIASENEMPKLVAGAGNIRIAGFVIPDLTTRNDLLDNRRRRIEDYRRARNDLEHRLQEKGVRPLAILPSRVWNRILLENGLYHFQPDKHGQIRVSIADTKYFQRVACVLNAVFWSAIPLLLTYIMIYQIDWQVPTIWNIGSLILMCTLWAIGIIFANLKKTPYHRLHQSLTHLLSRVYDVLPHRFVARRLLPHANWQYASTTTGSVMFPSAPDDIADILRRVSGMTGLKTAVVPEGFRFGENPSTYFRDNIDRDANTRQAIYNSKMWLPDPKIWLPDPIIYIEESEATAIVAQFGDFPIEREIVEKVCQNPEYLF